MPQAVERVALHLRPACRRTECLVEEVGIERTPGANEMSKFVAFAATAIDSPLTGEFVITLDEGQTLVSDETGSPLDPRMTGHRRAD